MHVIYFREKYKSNNVPFANLWAKIVVHTIIANRCPTMTATLMFYYVSCLHFSNSYIDINKLLVSCFSKQRENYSHISKMKLSLQTMLKRFFFKLTQKISVFKINIFIYCYSRSLK